MVPIITGSGAVVIWLAHSHLDNFQHVAQAVMALLDRICDETLGRWAIGVLAL